MTAAKLFFSTKSKLDPFLVLNVARNASSKEIKAAYFKLAKQYHPDSHSTSYFDNEKFLEITMAYEMLTKKHTHERLETKNSQSNYDKSFYSGTFSTGPLYMSNGKMAGLILFFSACGGILLSSLYLKRREKLRQRIDESRIQNNILYEQVIQKSKNTSLEEEIKKLEKRL